MKHDQLTFFNNADVNKEAKSVSFSMDKFYIAIVCIVLLFIVSFSLGVERGKHILTTVKHEEQSEFNLIKSATAESIKSLPATGAVAVEIVNNTGEVVSNIPAVMNVVEETKIIVTQEAPLKELVKKDKPVASKPRFAIQVASYAKRSYAEKEAEKLNAKGYKTRLIAKGKWVALTVGAYSDKKSATKALEDLKIIYKDCYIRNF